MKRKHEASVGTIKYTVFETKEDDSVYVDFMPQIWIVPPVFKERDCIVYHYPGRLLQQSKDSYMRELKQAKFIGAIPDRERWDVRTGRILKMNLGSIEEALESQKFYSDYFSTTEGESAIKTPAPVPKKTVRKKKNDVPAKKKAETSDSDDDIQGPQYTVSNYNTQFLAENAETPSDRDILSTFNVNQLMNSVGASFQSQNMQLDESQESIESLNIGVGSLSSDLTNEIFASLDVPTINIDQLQENCQIAQDQVDIVHESSGTQQQTNCHDITCCKGHQKVLNKIDYAQKKLSKELSLVRQETSSNRELLLKVLEVLGHANVNGQTAEDKHDDDQINEIDGELAHLNVDMAAVDSFNEKFKSMFPIECSEYVFDFNKSLKDDQTFAEQLFDKLSAITAEDEIKTVRKILKVLCGVRCLKDFTWQGTKKMKCFMDLHLIIELISNLLKAKYSKCVPMDIITKVVKQRTKSAKETWAGILTAEQDANVAKNQSNNENSSTTTAHPSTSKNLSTIQQMVTDDNSQTSAITGDNTEFVPADDEANSE